MDELTKMIKKFNEYLDNYKISVLFYTRDEISIMRSAVEMIGGHISKMINGETPEITNADMDFIRKCVLTTLNYTLISPIHKETREYLETFVYLVHNWNTNSINDADLEIILKSISQISTDHLTMTETTILLKECTSYFTKLGNWLPPSFEISKHYFDLLKEIPDTECKNV